MVALFLRDGSNPIHKIKRRLEIREAECPCNVMLVVHDPLGKLVAEVVKRFAPERRHSSAAGNASLVSQIGRHEYLQPLLTILLASMLSGIAG